VSALRIYIAASFRRREQCQQLVAMLEPQGCHVTSRWLKDPEAAGWAPAVAAERDMEDVRDASGVMFLAETPDVGFLTGGRHVEAGLALAWGKWLWVIGERENVFHHLGRVRAFPTVADWIRVMLRIPPVREVASARKATSNGVRAPR
jgi:hypothetical protein